MIAHHIPTKNVKKRNRDQQGFHVVIRFSIKRSASCSMAASAALAGRLSLTQVPTIDAIAAAHQEATIDQRIDNWLRVVRRRVGLAGEPQRAQWLSSRSRNCSRAVPCCPRARTKTARRPPRASIGPRTIFVKRLLLRHRLARGRVEHPDRLLSEQVRTIVDDGDRQVLVGCDRLGAPDFCGFLCPSGAGRDAGTDSSSCPPAARR